MICTTRALKDWHIALGRADDQTRKEIIIDLGRQLHTVAHSTEEPAPVEKPITKSTRYITSKEWAGLVASAPDVRRRKSVFDQLQLASSPSGSSRMTGPAMRAAQEKAAAHHWRNPPPPPAGLSLFAWRQMVRKPPQMSARHSWTARAPAAYESQDTIPMAATSKKKPLDANRKSYRAKPEPEPIEVQRMRPLRHKISVPIFDLVTFPVFWRAT